MEINAEGRAFIGNLLAEHYGTDARLQACIELASYMHAASGEPSVSLPAEGEHGPLAFTLLADHIGPALPPVFVFAHKGLQFSVRAPSTPDAYAAALEQVGQVDPSELHTVKEGPWYGAWHHADPVSYARMNEILSGWRNDPIYDLDVHGGDHPQHARFFTEYQDQVATEQEKEAQRQQDSDAKDLQERAAAAGVSPQVMVLLDAQARKIDTLERALRALVGGDDPLDSGACYRVLNGLE